MELTKSQQAFVDSDAPFSLLVGQAGAGKTVAGCAKVLKWALEKPNQFGLVCGKHYLNLMDSTYKKFKEMAESSNDLECFNVATKVLKFKNGTDVRFIALPDMETVKTIYAMEPDFFFFDGSDTIHEQAFNMLVYRTSRANKQRGGKFTIASSPVQKERWVNLCSSAMLKFSGKQQVLKEFHLNAVDNPYLPKDYVEKLKEL
jgi:phage terminase large subunit